MNVIKIKLNQTLGEILKIKEFPYRLYDKIGNEIYYEEQGGFVQITRNNNIYVNEENTFKSPVYNIKSIPLDKIEANDYNPNHVAKREMDLLYQSIKCDGYTMPIVCYFNKEKNNYTIVDGFHRYTIMLKYKDIYEREKGMIPVSVIEKDINDRMASTIRHNRARGKHEVELQAALVGMLKDGWDELKIMKELGMTLEEVQRLMGVKGIASEIKGVPYSIERQIKEVEEDINDDDFN